MAQVLRALPKQSDPNLLVGTEHFEDAGVYRLDDLTAIVVTVDFFPPLVDDPYTFGQIAAANSLSDIYAMGGRPLTALNIVGFPDEELPAEILGDILRGGGERVRAAGAVVAGGHSVRDTEIKFGLSVTGLIHPDQIVTNGGAREGDALVLTKPIGSGVLTSAAKANKIGDEDLAEAIDVMTDLNAGACEAMLEVGIHAATDITGFGLIGHAHEMGDAANVTLRINTNVVPLLEQTMKLAGKGMLTRAYQSNLAYVGDRIDSTGADGLLLNVLADAQTSGGLLIAVAPDKADDLVAGLKRRKTRAAAIIGDIRPHSDRTVVAMS